MFVFNVAEGDIITYYFPYFYYTSFYYLYPSSDYDDSLFQVKVTKVETVTISGQALRRIWTAPLNSSYHLGGSYTEKIRSSFLMIPFHPGAAIPENVEFSLRCYKDEIISPQHTDYACDYLYVGIHKWNNALSQISIYPNPSPGTFTIKMDLEKSSEITGILTDLSGRQVASFLLPSGLKEWNYPFQLSAGIYLLQLKSDLGAAVQKLVVY